MQVHNKIKARKSQVFYWIKFLCYTVPLYKLIAAKQTVCIVPASFAPTQVHIHSMGSFPVYCH